MTLAQKVKARVLQALLNEGYPVQEGDVAKDLPSSELETIIADFEGRIQAKEYQSGDLGAVDPWEDVPPELEEEYRRLQDEWAAGRLQSKLVRMSDGKIRYIRPYAMELVKQAGGKPYCIIQDGEVRFFQWHRPDRQGYHAVKATEINAVMEAHRQACIEAEAAQEAVRRVRPRLHARGLKPQGV